MKYNEIIKKYSMRRNDANDKNIYRLIELIEVYQNDKKFTKI